MKAEERDKTVKITFISNFLGPHQLPFCKAMVNRLGEDFKFVATEPMTEERIKLGWSLDKDTYPFEIKANESNELQKKAEQLAIESDVVIIGSAPDSYIIPRLKRNKLTFKYSERPLKKGIHWNNLAHIICGMWLHHGRFQSKPLYMLAASAYTADDYARFGCYRGKCYKWGYFPEAKKYDPDELMKGNVVMNYFLIPLFGASGAAFASVVTQISTIMIFPLFIRKMRPNVKLMLDAICLKDVF